MSKQIRRSSRLGSRNPGHFAEIAAGAPIKKRVAKAPKVVVVVKPPTTDNIVNGTPVNVCRGASECLDDVNPTVGQDVEVSHNSEFLNIEAKLDREIERLNLLKNKCSKVSNLRIQSPSTPLSSLSQVREAEGEQADDILASLGVLPVDDSGDFENEQSLPPMKSMQDFIASQGRAKSSSKLKSGIHEMAGGAVQRQVIWPHTLLDARFLASMDSKITYHDLDERLLTIGELNVFKSSRVSEAEKMARIELLEDILFNVPHYEWAALLRLHATILSGVEKGIYKFGDDFSKLENQILRPYPKRKSSSLRAGAPRLEDKQGLDKVYFCKDFNKSSCSQGDKHSAIFNGKKYTVKHICAKCWLKSRVQSNHPESSTSCPCHDL